VFVVVSQWVERPIFFASKHGHTAVVSLLLEAGADVEAADGVRAVDMGDGG